MPKERSNMMEKQILDLLKHKSHGAKIGEIEAELPDVVPRRTLFRRLSALVESGKATSIGKGSGTRYAIADEKNVLPLSADAEDVLAQVSLPIQKRKPVAYHPNFLYDYQPNVTYYLPEATRKHLTEIGQQFNHELEPGTYVKRVLHRLLIDLSWNSSRLEGNTYSLLETKRLIEFGATVEGKNALDAQMILNHKDAIEFMVNSVDDLGFNQYSILNIHAFLSNNLLANPKARGQLRQIPVGIGKTVYHPAEIPQLILECFQRILKIAEEIIDPFEQAFFVMVHLPYLQPFEDVNKRVSRLSANIPLIKNNLSPLSFVDVPKSDYISGLIGIYELNRIELFRDVFIWAYERSSMQYKLMIDTLGQPNIKQMQYKKELQQLITLIVTNNIRGKAIIETIQKWSSDHIKPEDVADFIQIAEKEIASLHHGNIAIYQIKPDVFSKWRMK